MVGSVQPQYSTNTNSYRTQNSPGAIFEGQYGYYSVTNQNNKRKGWNSSNSPENKGLNSYAFPANEPEAKGYFLTIPQEQLNKLKSYTPLSPLQQKIKNTFSADQNISRGSLVNMVF